MQDNIVQTERASAELASFDVSYREDTGTTEVFRCQAENEEHAVEQARNAYPTADILGATESEQHALVVDPDGDYILHAAFRGVWITVDNVSVHLIRTDEGLIVDLYPVGGEADGAVSRAQVLWAEAANIIGDPADPQDLHENLERLHLDHALAHVDKLSAPEKESALAVLRSLHPDAPDSALATSVPAARREGVLEYGMTCVDGNECSFQYGRRADGTVHQVARTRWSPEEPENHTAQASISLLKPDGTREELLELSGDDHRTLEGFGLLDGLLVALFQGADPATALQSALDKAD